MRLSEANDKQRPMDRKGIKGRPRSHGAKVMGLDAGWNKVGSRLSKGRVDETTKRTR